MKKNQWNDVKLQKKSKLYVSLSLLFSGIALIVYFLVPDIAIFWLAGIILVAVACYVLSSRVLDKDKQLKPKEEKDK